MRKMISNEFIKRSTGAEYLGVASVGDIFVSIHLGDGNCFAIFLEKKDFSITHLEEFNLKVFSFSSHHELQNAEIKLIGINSTIKIAEDFFRAKGILNIKCVQREDIAEILFLPLLNKVRVSKESINLVNPLAKLQGAKKFKILIVDDSKTIGTILSRIISGDPEFDVCAVAERPTEVEALILKHKPDVITLDIHMPEMNGVALLKIIGPKFNIPTIMISSISMAEGPIVLECMENGAIDYIQKPELAEIEKVTPLILEKIRMAAQANIAKDLRKRMTKSVQITTPFDLSSLVLIGSSTGGTEAIREIITALPAQIPPMLIVQHIPAIFSTAFAKRMNELCQFEVKEAENGDAVIANRILIAPGGKQMKFVIKKGKPFVEINNDEPVNRFKPSVDYMFMSVAKNIYTHTVAIILTGMGKDGARGMLELRKLGVRTIAQDEASSVVFGMPKEAIALGGAEFVVPLNEIAEKIALLSKEKITLKKIG
jgi:two-component system chemotaxis response regulator CheB